MPKCPECGEPVGKGQVHCFACGSDFNLTPVKSKFLNRNTVFIAAIVGGVIIAVTLALLITRSLTKSTPKSPESSVKSKISTPGTESTKSKLPEKVDDITHLSQDLKDLEIKIARIEMNTRAGQLTKDEGDALRFAQNAVGEMKSLLESIKTVAKKDEERKLIRQFRLKQKEAEDFLLILKKWL